MWVKNLRMEMKIKVQKFEKNPYKKCMKAGINWK